MEYAIVRAADGALIATGQSVQVTYDYTIGQAVPVSETLRRSVALRQQGFEPT